jgi:flavodoxin
VAYEHETGLAAASGPAAESTRRHPILSGDLCKNPWRQTLRTGAHKGKTKSVARHVTRETKSAEVKSRSKQHDTKKNLTRMNVRTRIFQRQEKSDGNEK